MNIRFPPISKPASAEEWVVRLHAPDCSAAEHAAFEDWLDAAPDHPVAYAEAEHLFSLSAQLAQDPMLAAQARQARRQTHRESTRWHPWPLAAAAAIVLAGVLSYRVLFPLPGTAERLATPIAECVESVLQDGSRLTMDADTVLEVAYTRRERRLTLLQGRVQIEAEPDASRPMLVHAGSGSVRVVGTTFQVQRLADDQVEVGLLQGAVTVTASDGTTRTQTLAAGQQLAYDRDGRMGPVRPLAVEDARAWTRGTLIFSDRPLDALVQEANRYTENKIVLADPQLGQIRVSGAFQAGEQDALVDALQAGWGLHAQTDAGGDIILHRQ